MVSILVLVDFVRNVSIYEAYRALQICFNPCFSGFCSECIKPFAQVDVAVSVSILVLVDFVRNECKLFFITFKIRAVSILVLVDFVRNAGYNQ